MTETPQLRKCSRCKCNILLETYYSKNRKGEYKKTCNGCQNRVSCPKCDYKCPSNCALQVHIKRIHDKIKDIKCSQCDYKCSTDGHLKRHVKSVHSKIKDIKCSNEGCDFKCSTKDDLTRHIKQVHDQIKDVQCPKCDYKGFTNSCLTRHIKQVHDQIKDVQCPKCDYKCSENSSLTKHIKAVHDKIMDLQCSLCDYCCADNGNLTRHIKQVHDKIKDFLCSNEGCDYKCSTSSDLKTHTKTCVGNEQGSSGEVKIKKVLNEMKIEFQYNSTYEVKAKYLLRWDFIITDYDDPIFIEYDGRQHFEPVNFGGISKEQAKINFEKAKGHDKIKNDYCDENGYHLLRIPYTEYANIEAIITEFMTTNTDWGNE